MKEPPGTGEGDAMNREITPQELAQRLAGGEPLTLVDVRQPWEHQTAALPGDLLIPLAELAQRAGEIRPPAGGMIVAYCHHGIRSRTAAAILEARGLGPVYSLTGGIDAWSRTVDPRVPRY
jgi:adenylyltransferase/sulfurtransferase